MYHFLSGYTAKVAGTERGVIEPSATFSACFASPFLPLPPSTYAELLGERLQKHHSDVWLVNTGWTGGPYGTGHRMPISATRAIITAILNGSLREAQFRTDPVFGLDYATSCPDVSPDLLDPRLTWNDGKAYDRQAKSLAAMFVDNFRQFETASPSMRAAGPSVG
jgi:phosphoenolpyruvate carboxykinase (ATP)